MRTIIPVCFFLLAVNIVGAQNYEAKIMSWNVLNWPSNSNLSADTTSRCPSYRAVINYAQPDVLVTCENTGNNSAPWFRDQVMNSGIYHYEAGTFINGYDSDNAIYYRDSLFDFVSNTPIQTALRDINCFTLVFKATGDTLHIFSCHLKASPGYEYDRAAEIAILRQYTNNFPSGTNFLIGGDFNFYESGEPGYTQLLATSSANDGSFNDPLHMTGIWNNYSYRFYHTQSTRFSSAGGGAGGGMNDRFDMLLYSDAVKEPTGAYFIPSSYINIGNDGQHFDDAINYGTNYAVPVDIANALFNASDHLPVMLTLAFGPNAGVGVEELTAGIGNVDIFPNPANDKIYLSYATEKPVQLRVTLRDGLGRTVLQGQEFEFSSGINQALLSLEEVKDPGIYILSMEDDNRLVYKRIIITR